METIKAIYERRTTHVFISKKVPESIILKAIKAANQAPCHKLTFPWRFYSLGINKRNQIYELAIQIKSSKTLLNQKLKNIIKEKYHNPSHLLVVSQKLNDDQFIKKEDYAACSCAIQNLSLSLTSDGVKTKWSTGIITRHPEIYNIIKIDSKLEEIIGFIWIGYGENSPKVSRPLISQIYKNI